jgi:hypothetical protein
MPRPTADDEIDELPPLDGADDGEAEATYDDLVDDASDDDSLDDATGEDDPVDPSDIDAEGAESGWLDDAEDADALDMGSELSTFEESGGHDPKLDFEELGVDGEDFGLGGDESAASLDAGDEGPVAADEELREQDLPRLDADEEGEVEDAELIEVGFAEEAPIARAPQLWARVGAPVDVGRVSAIACAGRGVVVATDRGLVRVDLEGACEPVDARERAAFDSLASLDATAAARAGHTALVTDEGHVELDGAIVPSLASVVAIAFADDGGTLLAATYRETEDTSSIVRVAGGSVTIVAEVSGDAELDGRVSAIVRDDAHGVVWIGGGFGLIALEPTLPSQE